MWCPGIPEAADRTVSSSSHPPPPSGSLGRWLTINRFVLARSRFRTPIGPLRFIGLLAESHIIGKFLAFMLDFKFCLMDEAMCAKPLGNTLVRRLV
jgi:hypothetical protein